MPIETNLNTNPYYDDFDELKNYHKILYKPSTPVQARELTQVQTILQNQIERFGDHVFKEGAIVQGCTFTFMPGMKYLKIEDLTTAGVAVNLSSYLNMATRNSNNLIGTITNVIPGLEAQNPDLNTLYINYLNSGTNSEKVYVPSETLTVFDPTINQWTLTVADTSSFSNGEFVVQDTTLANGQIDSIANSTTLSLIDTYGTFSNTANVVGQTSGANESVSAVLDESIIDEIRIANTSFESTGNLMFDVIGTGYGFGISDGIVYQKGHFIRSNEQSIIVSKYNELPDNLQVGFVTLESIANSSVDTTLLDNALGFPNENAPGADRLKLVPTLVIGNAAEVSFHKDFSVLVEWQNGQPIRKNQSGEYNLLGRELAKRTSEESGDYVVKLLPFFSEEIASNTTHTNLVVGAGVGYVKGFRQELHSPYRLPVEKATQSAFVNDLNISVDYGYYALVDEAAINMDFNDASICEIYDTAQNIISSTTGPIASISPTGTQIGTSKIRSIILEKGVPGTPTAQYRVYLFDIKMFKGRSFSDAKAIFFNGASASYDGVADFVLENSIPSLKGSEKNALVFPVGKKGIKTFRDDGSSNLNKFRYRTTSNAYSFSVGGLMTIGPLAADTTFPYTPSSILSSDEKKDFVIINTSGTDFRSNETPTGTVSTTGANTHVAGSGTTFFSDYDIGDYIELGGISEIRRIVNINSDTSITVDNDFSSSAANTHYRSYPSFVPINTTRDDVTITMDGTSLNATVDLGANVDSSQFCTVFYNAEKDIAAEKSKTLSTVFVTVDTSSRAFVLSTANTFANEVITGGTSGATANCGTIQTDYNTGNQYLIVNEISGTFQPGETITGGTSSDTGVIGSIEPMINSGLPVAVPSKGPYCLGLPDVYSIEAVTANTTQFSETGTDVTSNFELISNQRDSYYGLSYAKVKNSSTYQAQSVYLTFRLKVFEYASGGFGFFNVDSYPIDDVTATLPADKIRTQNIPIFTSPRSGQQYDLRNVMDFRPYVDSTASYAATVGAATNTPSSTEIYDVGHTGGSPDRFFPVPNDVFNTTLEYYLPRRDKVALAVDGTIKHIMGTASETPQYPADLPEAMTLADIEVPVFPSLSTKESVEAGRPDYGIATRLKQVKRYTMKDIGDLEKRVVNVEYYTSLSLLEKNAKDLYITDATGNDRFKNGFLVDNYRTFQTTDLEHPEFNAAIDPAAAELIPPFSPNKFELKVSTLNNTMRSGDKDESLITLPYTHYELLQQNKFASVRNTASFQYNFVGTIEMTPNYDNFYDVNKPRNAVAVIDVDVASPVEGLIASINENLSAQMRTEENLPPVRSASSGSEQTRTLADGTVETFVRTTTTTTNTTEITQNSVGVTTPSSRESVGDFVTDITFKPFMREQQVSFRVTGLRPNTRHYVFFDQMDVTSMCAQADVQPEIAESQFHYGRRSFRMRNRPTDATRFPAVPAQPTPELTSNEFGELNGVFYMPGGTFYVGDRLMEVVDIELYNSIDSASTSYAKGQFHAYNYSATKTELVTSVRQPDVAPTSIQSTESSTSTSTRTVVTGRVPPPTQATPTPKTSSPPAACPIVNPTTPQPAINTNRSTAPVNVATTRNVTVNTGFNSGLGVTAAVISNRQTITNNSAAVVSATPNLSTAVGGVSQAPFRTMVHF